MDFSLVEKAVQCHGDELLSALHLEQGENFVQQINLSKLPVNSGIDKIRAITDDRRKTLVSFIAKKADMLFKNQQVHVLPVVSDLDNKDFYAVLPPLECFMNTSQEGRIEHFYRTLAKGDVIVGTVFGKHTHGLIITLVCVSGGKMRDIHDLGLKCFCNTNQIPLASNHEEPLEAFQVGENIQGVVLEVLPDTHKIYVSMKESALPSNSSFKLGLITDDDIPTHHKETVKYCGQAYSRAIEKTLGFMNPSTVSHLSALMGLELGNSPSLMRGLHEKQYPKEDFASEIFKLQCGKWAYKSVEQGIQHFKLGNNVEAFQCLNKALQIDPRNVEALVARGALFANNNSFSRALEDFYKALDYNSHHVNAGKYTVETLVAYGKQHQEHARIEEAIKCFQKALVLNPSHAEAMLAMRSSQKKVEELEKERTRQLELEIENKAAIENAGEDPSTSKTSVTKERLKQLLNVDKDSKNDKSNCWPSSSSTSSLTSDSTSSASSDGVKHKRRSIGVPKLQGARSKRDGDKRSSSPDERLISERSRRASHSNNTSRRRRSSSSSSSSSSYESARRSSKSSASKRKRRRSDSRATNKKSRRDSSISDSRRASRNHHPRKSYSKSQNRSSSSDTGPRSSSPQSRRNGNKKRSSNSFSILDSSHSSSRSQLGTLSRKRAGRKPDINSKDIGGSKFGAPSSKDTGNNGHQRSTEFVAAEPVSGGRSNASFGEKPATSSDLKFPIAGQSFLNLPGKVERSLSNASSTSSVQVVQVVTPGITTVDNKGSGGKLKELELFLATLKANKMAGKSKV